MKQNPDPSHSSFRDPNGYVFLKEGIIYRSVHERYQPHYDKLMKSGLYDELVKEKWLIPHREAEFDTTECPETYRILQPVPIPFISYPYEWCFSQLKDAALLTLNIQKTAMKYQMGLKDASGFNIQWKEGKPVFIDTLSFEIYQEGEPWVAYRQFCEHFLAPLALMCHTDVRLGLLLKDHIDGIPLDLARKLLPSRTKRSPSLLLHIHLHAKSILKNQTTTKAKPSGKRFSKTSLKGLIDNLESCVKNMRLKDDSSNWVNYYEETILGKEYLEHKQQLVKDFISELHPLLTWDLGANTGVFSRMLPEKTMVISFDHDAGVVEKNYLTSREKGEKNILPLLLDLTNPSSAVGWNNKERFSIFGRTTPDLVMALALVHHLCISNNIPLAKLAAFFKELGPWLLIEFVPKEDPKIQELLKFREDIFHDYHQETFEESFGQWFTIVKKSSIQDSGRSLYLMQKIG